MTPADKPVEVDAGGAAYAQPTPRRLYVHDDLTDEVERRLGPHSAGAALAQRLLTLLAGLGDRVRVLTLAEQVDRVLAQGPHEPFDLCVGIGRAGERVARVLHARAGWFPRICRVGLTREENGRGGYHLIHTEPSPVRALLDEIGDAASVAVVDDTVFSGLTMRTVIESLPPAPRSRAHAFCLRGVADSIAAVA
jgi:hypothetical protein